MWFWKSGSDLGIDLGTATVLVYVKGKGIVLKEPSVVAINTSNGKVLAVGEEARKMIGRTPGNIIAVRPLKDGVISDYDVTEKMLKEFIGKALGNKKITTPNIMVCVPSQASEVEKRAVMEAARNSGGIVVRSSIKVAGDKFDEAIIKYIRTRYKIMIGEKTAEQIKIEIGSAFNNSRNEETSVKGRNLVTGLPDEIKITSSEIREALKEPVNLIVEAVKGVLEKTPPEISADIIEKGILMTGGGSLLHGLDKLIESETGVSVNVAENSIEAVAEGTGSVLGYIDKLDKAINDQEVVLIE